MDEKKRRFGAIDVINVAGSIASITGISLLWLKGSMPPAALIAAIPVVAIAVTLSLGLFALAFVIIRYGYYEFVATRDMAWKFTYVCLTIAVALFFIAIAEYFICGVSYSAVRAARDGFF
jgi:hypothetical protein